MEMHVSSSTYPQWRKTIHVSWLHKILMFVFKSKSIKIFWSVKAKFSSLHSDKAITHFLKPLFFFKVTLLVEEYHRVFYLDAQIKSILPSCMLPISSSTFKIIYLLYVILAKLILVGGDYWSQKTIFPLAIETWCGGGWYLKKTLSMHVFFHFKQGKLLVELSWKFC